MCCFPYLEKCSYLRTVRRRDPVFKHDILGSHWNCRVNMEHDKHSNNKLKGKTLIVEVTESAYKNSQSLKHLLPQCATLPVVTLLFLH